MSTQPGRIKKEFAVQAARPHDNGDPLIHFLENKIMEVLTDEMEKVVREEMGNEYSIQKNTFSDSSADSVGDGI
jgi:NitT/TauT family transport system ATP-binding protein